MSLSPDEMKKIAHLARLELTNEEIELYAPQLSGILKLIAEMNQIDTSKIEPLAHPLDISQRLRADVVTATDQREKYQSIAPAVAAGLYLVPQVIDEA